MQPVPQSPTANKAFDPELQMLEEQRKPVIITQNGEARAVIQDVALL